MDASDETVPSASEASDVNTDPLPSSEVNKTDRPASTSPADGNASKDSQAITDDNNNNNNNSESKEDGASESKDDKEEQKISKSWRERIGEMRYLYI